MELTERPEVLEGSTYKIKVPTLDHAVYITITNLVTENGIIPWEIFLSSKDMSQFQWITALMRTISFVFRYSPERVRDLIEELKTVSDPKDGNYFKKGHNGLIMSLVADIAMQIEKHIDSIGEYV